MMRVPGAMLSPFKSKQVIRRPSTCATGQKGDGEWSPGFTSASLPDLNSIWPSVEQGPILTSERMKIARLRGHLVYGPFGKLPRAHNSTPF